MSSDDSTRDPAYASTLTQTGSGPAAPAKKEAPGPRGAAGIPPSLHARFEGFHLLGRGGMGEVYRARDLRLGRTVAVKLIFAQGRTGGLLHEARSQARLRHPNVCEIHEAGVADGVPFIVMRHIEGRALDDAAAEMSPEQKIATVRDVALALHEAHRHGLVHRDVKPGNILVERSEDGLYTPFVVDFGIARDLTLETATLAEGVQGTPAFMAPEQAAGKTRSVDRRSDVYSLGATLFDTLAGRPPFTDPSLVALLKSVIEADAPLLRSLAPEVPREVEAIVARCLEKDPAARYDSARALAEDLQRFLDGNPVLAARPSLGYRLWKKVKKHKARVAAGAAAAVMALSVAGLWVRDRAIASRREALARELGGSVREMEMFLRQAHTLPLHDVEREREEVRGRLREIEERMAAAGDVARGPGHDALGRGHLALQDARAALAHLTQAEAAGDGAPGLDYAIGLAHIELYREALEKANTIQKTADKEAFVAAAEREHKEPALAHLKAALGRGIESPAYARGLVALHEGRLDDALGAAKEAIAAAPWLYEAKKLEGDALAAMGSLTGPERAFDAERAQSAFERAAAAYAAAADTARSDPAVHEAECDLWIKAMNAAAEAEQPMRPAFERATAACERAVAASPGRASGHVKLAFAHTSFSHWVATGHPDGEHPEQALSRATERVEEAARRSPDSAFASYLEGYVFRARAIYEIESGRDEGESVDRAIAGYERALTLDPMLLWAMNEEAGTLAIKGERDARLGRDPTPALEKALSRCGQASSLDPEFMYSRGTAIWVHIVDATRLAAAGASPAKVIERGLAAARTAEARHPTWKWLPYWRATLHRVQAEHDLASGADPSPALSRTEESLGPARGEISEVAGVEGEIATVRAEWLLSRSPVDGEALSRSVAAARSAFARALKATSWEFGYAVWWVRAELAELAYLTAAGRATREHADAALAPLSRFLAEDRQAPLLHEMGARAHEARAEVLARLGQDDGPEITACIQLAEKAVASGPGVARAHATLGRCRLHAARRAKDAAERRGLAGLAAGPLREAARRNPLLAGACSPLLAEAERLGSIATGPHRVEAGRRE